MSGRRRSRAVMEDSSMDTLTFNDIVDYVNNVNTSKDDNVMKSFFAHMKTGLISKVKLSPETKKKLDIVYNLKYMFALDVACRQSILKLSGITVRENKEVISFPLDRIRSIVGSPQRDCYNVLLEVSRVILHAVSLHCQRRSTALECAKNRESLGSLLDPVDNLSILSVVSYLPGTSSELQVDKGIVNSKICPYLSFKFLFLTYIKIAFFQRPSYNHL